MDLQEPTPWAMGMAHALNTIALQTIAHRVGSYSMGPSNAFGPDQKACQALVAIDPDTAWVIKPYVDQFESGDSP
jgi:hypothetical protein